MAEEPVSEDKDRADQDRGKAILVPAEDYVQLRRSTGDGMDGRRGMRIVRAYSESHHAGPLPHPDLLKGYGEIDPSFPERILAMAEKQASHRRGMEQKAMQASIEDNRADRIEARIGQFCALGIGIAVLTCIVVVFAIAPGGAATTLGSVLGGSYLVALVAAFIHGRKAPENTQSDSPTPSQEEASGVPSQKPEPPDEPDRD